MVKDTGLGLGWCIRRGAARLLAPAKSHREGLHQKIGKGGAGEKRLNLERSSLSSVLYTILLVELVAVVGITYFCPLNYHLRHGQQSIQQHPASLHQTAGCVSR